jgi:signal transduction histidine kinase
LADLYRSSQLELEQLQKRLFDVTDSVASMQLLIDEAMVVLDERQKQIEKQERLLNAQNNELIAGKLEIQNQKNDLLNHKNQLKKQEQQLNDQVALIAKHQSDIDKQKDSMAVQLYEINSARAKLDSLIHEIDVQNEYLSNQYSVIKRQRVSLLTAAIAGFMTLILLVVLYVSFRGKIRHNRILKEQKQHIENVNQKMKRVNQHLYGIIARLRETQTQLITAEKMASLGVLTAGVAHEINNPINFIYTGINSLENDYNDLVQFFEGVLNSVAEKPDMSQHLKQATDNSDYYELIEIIPQTIKDIKVGAERAADIVKGLRNFSRIDKDSMQPANIHDGIDSAILLLRNKFKYHVEVVKEYGKVPVVMCYPGKLNQVFLNILSNAIDAISDKGRITIKTYTQKEYLIISFHDNGKGIAPEILDKVFDPFFTTKTVGQGVGLGLSISYSIIQEHNGHIEVKSNKNSGTEFTISLPCIDLQNEEK